LVRLYEAKRASVRGQWDRDLPIDELLFDRWERSRSLGFGEGSSIYHLSYVFGDVVVGDRTWIGPFAVLDGSGGLRIGAGCDISAGVHIYTHDTVRRVLSDGRMPIDKAPVDIGDACHIGSSTVIMGGVTIGHHSVIGSGSFVNRDIPPHSVAVGTPCRVIGRVESHRDGSVRMVYDRD
jgi:acetyltransferase-like isoleucine patch superfamily enzyme